MIEVIELVGAFADGKRVEVRELPDAYYAVHPDAPTLIADMLAGRSHRLARFHRTERTHAGARVYEFNKQWGGE